VIIARQVIKTIENVIAGQRKKAVHKVKNVFFNPRLLIQYRFKIKARKIIRAFYYDLDRPKFSVMPDLIRNPD
jgi:hypothetical protein